jgi:hypothetical protein
VEKYGRAIQATDANIIRCMHIACWITEATVTHSDFSVVEDPILWVTVPCRLICRYQSFRGPCCLCLQSTPLVGLGFLHYLEKPEYISVKSLVVPSILGYKIMLNGE